MSLFRSRQVSRAAEVEEAGTAEAVPAPPHPDTLNPIPALVAEFVKEGSLLYTSDGIEYHITARPHNPYVMVSWRTANRHRLQRPVSASGWLPVNAHTWSATRRAGLCSCGDPACPGSSKAKPVTPSEACAAVLAAVMAGYPFWAFQCGQGIHNQMEVVGG